MNRWRLARCAWVEDGDTIIAVSLRAPMTNPLRLEGSAAICWAALVACEGAVTAAELARTVLGDADDDRPEEIARGIAEFLDHLVRAGIAFREAIS